MTDHKAVNDALKRFESDGEFERDWEAAMQKTTTRGWTRTAIVPALVAATVLAWVGYTTLGPVLMPDDAPLENGDHAAAGRKKNTLPVDDGVIRMGPGQVAIWAPDRVPKSISVVLPDIVQIQNLNNGRFQLSGMRPGKTDLIVTYEGTEPELLHAEVTTQPLSPNQDHDWQVGWGTYRMLDIRGATAISVTDPDVVKVQNMGDGLAALQGVRPGTTDMVVTDGTTETIYTLTVGDSVGPETVETIELEVGSVSLKHLDGVKSVAIADPDVVRANSLGNLDFSFEAIRPGRTDALIRTEEAVLHLRFEVTMD